MRTEYIMQAVDMEIEIVIHYTRQKISFLHLSAQPNRLMLLIDTFLLLISNLKLLFDGNTITYILSVSYTDEEWYLIEETQSLWY